MSQLINLGCKVADVHHRYDEVHDALFGTSSMRLLIDAMLGRRRRTYAKSVRTLIELQGELAALETQIADPAQVVPVTGADREAQQVLQEYTRALSKAISGLQTIFEQLEQDEAAYRDSGSGDRSGFTVDKLHYDHLLSELERLGTRLNKLFSHY
jgi:hypothetical protein